MVKEELVAWVSLYRPQSILAGCLHMLEMRGIWESITELQQHRNRDSWLLLIKETGTRQDVVQHAVSTYLINRFSRKLYKFCLFLSII